MPRPRLPLEVEAGIETAREAFYAARPLDKIFAIIGNPPSIRADGSIIARRPQASRIKLAFQEYACGLFDCEARFYVRHAQSSAVPLSLWLMELSACIVDDVNGAVERRSRETLLSFDLHCSTPDRIDAMFESLEQRRDYWLKIAEHLDSEESMKIDGAVGHSQPVPISIEEPAPAVNMPGESPKTIIDDFRIQKGWSLDEIADKAGIARKQVFKVRNGRPVRPYVLAALGTLLGVDATRLRPK